MNRLYFSEVILLLFDGCYGVMFSVVVDVLLMLKKWFIVVLFIID